MKILVVGSKGFIGEHLKRFLLDKQEDVWGADVVVDYVHPEKYFLIDASNADFQSVFNKEIFDVCINCSGAASVPDSLQHPLRDFNLNTVNVFRLLDCIRIYQPSCKFINLSSAAVYGNPATLPIKENSQSSPLSPYGNHKMMSEQICAEFYQFFQIKTCSLRIFSAYGAGLKKQLFWDLYQKTKSGNKITLYGTGKESRDFIYIKDLVQAIYLVVLNGSFQGETINIGNGEETMVKDCVDIFYGFFNKPLAFDFAGQSREGDPNNWVADISTLTQLGYKQQHSLKEGLKNYYEWIRRTDSALE